MRKTPYELMLVRVHEIVNAADLRYEFDTSPHFHLRLEQEGYHPLEMESSPSPDPLFTREKRRIKIGHYVLQDGVEVPELELEMNDTGTPLTLKQWTGRAYHLVFRDPATQQVKINYRLRRDIADLLLIWARNIRAQGWIEIASHLVSGDWEGQRRLQSSEAPGIALAIDLEVADQEGTTIEDLEADELPDYGEALSALEYVFLERTQTPQEICQFLDRDPWWGHLRILLLNQRELTAEQKRWLQTDGGIAWYSTSLVTLPDQ